MSTLWAPRWTAAGKQDVKCTETVLVFKVSPLEVISVDVGADHLHAAGVDEALHGTFHARFDHVLRS